MKPLTFVAAIRVHLSRWLRVWIGVCGGWAGGRGYGSLVGELGSRYNAKHSHGEELKIFLLIDVQIKAIVPRCNM